MGFSIESEMLTYRALESNAEAVACDVAAYVTGAKADFKNLPTGEACTLTPAPAGAHGVLLAPFDSHLLDDFHLWRVQMEFMRELRHAAEPYCPQSAVLAVSPRGSPGAAAAAVAKSSFDLTSAGAALTLAQTMLGMFAVVSTNTAVAGTIQDQAFLDGVARELRALGIAVLMPSAYTPFSLAPLDAAHSPFLTSLDQLLSSRSCLEDKASRADTGALEKARIQALLTEMNAYVAFLRGAAMPPPSDKAGRAADSTTTRTAPTETVVSPLPALLAGDGLAQQLGADPNSGLIATAGRWQHILLIKALESGGTVAKSANIFGSRIRYSGGSVGTFALFAFDGVLECSGNVYEYGGSIRANEFPTELRRYKPDPGAQFIFQRGTCVSASPP
jgi:hypothetical protein